MTCRAIRLLTDTECGVCGRTVPGGYAIITDEPEHPIWLVVCASCTSGLGGLRVAEAAFGSKGIAWPALEPGERV